MSRFICARSGTKLFRCRCEYALLHSGENVFFCLDGVTRSRATREQRRSRGKTGYCRSLLKLRCILSLSTTLRDAYFRPIILAKTAMHTPQIAISDFVRNAYQVPGIRYTSLFVFSPAHFRLGNQTLGNRVKK